MRDRTSPKKFTLVQKLIASYAAMTFFTVAALIISTIGVFSLNRTARDIAQNDLVLVGSLNKLRESFLAQERYAGKYVILKSPEFADLFRRREEEFLKLLKELRRSPSKHDFEGLDKLYQSYRGGVVRLISGEEIDPIPLKSTAAKIVNSIDTIYANEQNQLNKKLEEADRKERTTINWTLTLSFAGFLLAIIVAILFIIRISTAINKLKKATHRIAEGDFDFDPQIPPGDEVGDLARDFTRMAAKLKELEQISLDASPLTRLPGNIAIERVLKERVNSGEPFAVCYADLDNLKAYNDHYGYIKASEVIRIAGEIIFEGVKRIAKTDAFVGHIGGDDFVMVLDSEKASAACEEVIRQFDAEIVKHYTPEDLAKGAIEAEDRYGVPRVFPIMTISIAVVICRQGEYDSIMEIAKTSAEIKDYVKGKPGSNYFINRRKTKR